MALNAQNRNGDAQDHQRRDQPQPGGHAGDTRPARERPQTSGEPNALEQEAAANVSEQVRTGAGSLPALDISERRQVADRAAISALVVHETVREEGERELRRHPSALAWSGLAAGLSMGFSLTAQGLIRAYIPDVSWRPLISSFGYSLGFLIVILGRQQLFTENTLTVMLPFFARPSLRMLVRVARLWAIVLLANILGAFIFAMVAARTPIFTANVQHAFSAIGVDSMRGGFSLTVLRGIFAGWLIALMVWLLPGAQATRLHIIILITYIVALGGFAHIIAGSVDTLFLVSSGQISWADFLGGFFAPTLIGNIAGGVSLVAALNFAQVASETLGQRPDQERPDQE